MQAPPTRDGPRVNEEIRVPQVRLIDAEGEMMGVMGARDAMLRAYAVGLDLVEISPNADPPVCKILDYGKFKYEQQKKKNEAKKKIYLKSLKRMKKMMKITKIILIILLKMKKTLQTKAAK